VTDLGGILISRGDHYAPFHTPQATQANGLVNDVPVGTCFSVPPPPNRCVLVTQLFNVVVPNTGSSGSTTFDIKTITFRRDCEQGVRVTIQNPNMQDQVFTLGSIN